MYSGSFQWWSYEWLIFLKFQNFPLDILFLYSEGEKKPIKSIGSVSHRYWFSYWAKGSFTAWETLIFPLCITPQEKKCVRLFVYGHWAGWCTIKSKWRQWSLRSRWPGMVGDPVILYIFYHANIERNLSSYPSWEIWPWKRVKQKEKRVKQREVHNINKQQKI